MMSVDKSVLLPLAPAAAFALFTERVSEWWPPERRHTSDPASLMFLLETGRFYERASDGREVELGRVRVWDAPSRLVLDFYPGTDAAHPTEVTVRFEAEGAGTRVSIHHVPTEASRELWASRAPRYVASWDVVLPALARAAGPA